jgi:hypothetical protein
MATFKITPHSRDGDDGIRALRAALKDPLWRRQQLRCLDAREVKDQDNVDRTNETDAAGQCRQRSQ